MISDSHQEQYNFDQFQWDNGQLSLECDEQGERFDSDEQKQEDQSNYKLGNDITFTINKKNGKYAKTLNKSIDIERKNLLLVNGNTWLTKMVICIKTRNRQKSTQRSQLMWKVEVNPYWYKKFPLIHQINTIKYFKCKSYGQELKLCLENYMFGKQYIIHTYHMHMKKNSNGYWTIVKEAHVNDYEELKAEYDELERVVNAINISYYIQQISHEQLF